MKSNNKQLIKIKKLKQCPYNQNKLKNNQMTGMNKLEIWKKLLQN